MYTKYREKLLSIFRIYDFLTFETEHWVSTGLHNPRIVLIKLQPCLASSHWLDSTLALSGKRSLVIGQTAVLSDKLSLTSCSLIQQLCIVAIIHFISLRAKSFSGPSEIYMRIYFTNWLLFAYRRDDLHSQSRVKDRCSFSLAEINISRYILHFIKLFELKELIYYHPPIYYTAVRYIVDTYIKVKAHSPYWVLCVRVHHTFIRSYQR